MPTSRPATVGATPFPDEVLLGCARAPRGKQATVAVIHPARTSVMAVMDYRPVQNLQDFPRFSGSAGESSMLSAWSDAYG